MSKNKNRNREEYYEDDWNVYKRRDGKRRKTKNNMISKRRQQRQMEKDFWIESGDERAYY